MYPRIGHQKPIWKEWSIKDYTSLKKKGIQQRKRREKAGRERRESEQLWLFSTVKEVMEPTHSPGVL